MAILGVDDYLNFGEREGHGNEYSREAERIVSSIIRVYAEIIAERESKGDYYLAMSRSDYLKHKKSSDPTKSEIETTLGSWSAAIQCIPSELYQERRRFLPEDLNVYRFYDIIYSSTALFRPNGDPKKITIREYNEFKSINKSLRIPGWRGFARVIVGEDKWSRLVSVACDFCRRSGYNPKNILEYSMEKNNVE